MFAFINLMHSQTKTTNTTEVCGNAQVTAGPGQVTVEKCKITDNNTGQQSSTVKTCYGVGVSGGVNKSSIGVSGGINASRCVTKETIIQNNSSNNSTNNNRSYSTNTSNSNSNNMSKSSYNSNNSRSNINYCPANTSSSQSYQSSQIRKR
jgi:hypothetical protein